MGTKSCRKRSVFEEDDVRVDLVGACEQAAQRELAAGQLRRMVDVENPRARGRCSPRHLAVDAAMAGERALPREALRVGAARLRRRERPDARPGVGQAVPQPGWALGGDDEVGAESVDRLGKPARIGDNHGRATRQRFERHQPEALE